MKKVIMVVALLVVMVGCTDSQRSNIGTLGSEGSIKCYSGGILVYRGTSTGKISTVSNSDGWEFRDKNTGKFVRVSGDCIIEN